MSANYTVFIDESFFEWFGLPKNESSLCYGALSIPTRRLADLDRFEKAVRQFAFSKTSPQNQANGFHNEFKYTKLRRLKPQVIDEIGRKMAYFLEKNEARLFGLFVPAGGFYHYMLRSDFIDNPQSLQTLPEAEYKRRIADIQTEMLQKWESQPHNVGLLKDFYKTFFNFIARYHGNYLKKSYCIVYDSRNTTEDAMLHSDAEKFISMTDRLTPGGATSYKGYVTESSSSSSGLRLTDWLVGELRGFFSKNESLLAGSGRLEILSPYLNPKMSTDGFYRRELSGQAKNSFFETGNGFMLPRIKDFFANGLLTYYTMFGEARHIFIPKLVALDMAD